MIIVWICAKVSSRCSCSDMIYMVQCFIKSIQELQKNSCVFGGMILSLQICKPNLRQKCCPVHTYIHTLLARPQGAFQSQITLHNSSGKIKFQIKLKSAFRHSLITIYPNTCRAFVQMALKCLLPSHNVPCVSFFSLS